MKINLVYPDNGVGLSQDANILADVLCKHEIRRNFKSAQNRNDINIFLEVINQDFLPFAHRNILVPNAEWFYPQWRKYLYRFESVLCKTNDCLRIFSVLHKGCHYTSFTSQDRLEKSVQRERTMAHFAGKSNMKGTKQIVKAWQIYQLPPLIVYAHNGQSYGAVNNITFINKRLTDDEMKREQNRHLFHLCPSEYEGFGHYINEAKSVGAVIITTNACPMNELVTSEFGFACSFSRTSPHNEGVLYSPEPSSLASVIQAAHGCSDSMLERLSKLSRESFLENDALFKANIKSLF